MVTQNYRPRNCVISGFFKSSVMTVSNQIGVVQPVAEIAKLCNSHGELFHTDAVQAVGHGLREILTKKEIHFQTISGNEF